MRKTMCAAIGIWCATQAAATVSVGIDVAASLERDRDVAQEPAGERTTTTVEFGLGVQPTVLVDIGERFELAARPGFRVSSGKSETEQPSGDVETEAEWGRFGFGLGGGLSLKALEGDVFRLSAGPDIEAWLEFDEDNDEYFRFAVPLSLTGALDLVLSERAFLRASHRFFQAGFVYEKTSQDDHSRQVDVFDIQTTWTPRLAFFLSF